MEEKRRVTIEEIRDYVEREVAGGFYDADEIAQGVFDLFGDEIEPEVCRETVKETTREAFEKHILEQSTWPEVTDCDRLDAAFEELESWGIISRQNFSCCGNCGSYEIGDEMRAAMDEGRLVRGYTFYHVQDTESAAEGHGLFFSYGSVEDGEPAALEIGHEIMETLRRHDLYPDWDGTWTRRIQLYLDWKRRRTG